MPTNESEVAVPLARPYDVAGIIHYAWKLLREVKPDRELLKPINAFNKTAARVWWLGESK